MQSNSLYTLDVFLISGSIRNKFAKKASGIIRTIEIKGNQTLEQLHDIIFESFDREEEHLYMFKFGKGPRDPNGKRYELKDIYDDPVFDRDTSSGDVAKTTLDSLHIEVGQAFGYCFDFGDEWWHQINVVAIGDSASRGKYPKITKRIGESPPQYDDWDEEDEDDE